MLTEADKDDDLKGARKRVREGRVRVEELRNQLKKMDQNDPERKGIEIKLVEASKDVDAANLTIAAFIELDAGADSLSGLTSRY